MIILRPAREIEIEALAELGLSAWCKGIGPHVSPDVVRRVTQNNPFLPFLRDLGAQVLVAEIDGCPAGIGASEHADNCISDIWVSPLFEGRGVGSALIAALEQKFTSQGFAEVLIQVTAANSRAYGLYRHLGFVEIWRRKELDPVLNTVLEKVGLSKPL